MPVGGGVVPPQVSVPAGTAIAAKAFRWRALGRAGAVQVVAALSVAVRAPA